MQKNLSRAERDNDLIYHQDVPSTSALPAIQEVSMVQPLTEPGLQDPKAVIGADGVIFGELLGWGAQLAIGMPSILSMYTPHLTRHGCIAAIYNDRRRNWIAEEITERARRLDDGSKRCRADCRARHCVLHPNVAFIVIHHSVLDSLNLPAALDALDRPIGLPPSLLKKAEEVRLENGPDRIEASIRDVETLANHNSALLDEVPSCVEIRLAFRH